MTEPQYVYVKGQGWVANYAESLTERIGLWNVTLQIRPPEIGEFYWEDTGPLEEVMRNFRRWSIFNKPNAKLGVFCV